MTWDHSHCPPAIRPWFHRSEAEHSSTWWQLRHTQETQTVWSIQSLFHTDMACSNKTDGHICSVMAIPAHTRFNRQVNIPEKQTAWLLITETRQNILSWTPTAYHCCLNHTIGPKVYHIHHSCWNHAGTDILKRKQCGSGRPYSCPDSVLSLPAWSVLKATSLVLDLMWFPWEVKDPARTLLIQPWTQGKFTVH